jgi:gliding motility-associated-like protein
MKSSFFRIGLIIWLLFYHFAIQAQVKVPFLPRQSMYAPGAKNFKLRGDFRIIGNTNLTLENYADNLMNDNKLIYVDVDNDPQTLNSSSAWLEYSTGNEDYLGCNAIIFAGLYWIGRGSPNPTFTVNKNNVTKTFDKREIKLKAEAAPGYTTFRAEESDIRFPVGLDDANDLGIFVGFVDITEYIKTWSSGNMYVADIALLEGTNYHIGGWSMVVVYQNPLMPYRDITIFDGYAYVRGNVPAEFNIPLEGIRTVDEGPVKVKIGLMAGEGDVAADGDYFEIEKKVNSGEYVKLKHSGNEENNFFNSSINVGGFLRNPKLKNNTGIDLSVIEILNPDNEVIGNSQERLNFRYGTTWDALVIYNLTVAVESDEPEIEAFHKLVNYPANNLELVKEVKPGDRLEFKVEIKNKGGIELRNNTLKIPLPAATDFVEANVVFNITAPGQNQPTLITEANGEKYIYWEIGDLPAQTDLDRILAEMTYTIQITGDCLILLNDCHLLFDIDGIMEGQNSQSERSYPPTTFVKSYKEEDTGLCIKEPVFGSHFFNILPNEYIYQNCAFDNENLTINVCFLNESGGVSGDVPMSYFPEGTRYFNEYPITPNTIEYNAAGNRDYPNTEGVFYYAVYDLDNPDCYKKFKFKNDDLDAEVAISEECESSDGKREVKVIPTEGMPPYLFYWQGEPSPSLDTRRLEPGVYSIMVSSPFCEREIIFEVPEFDKPELKLISEESIISEICQGSKDGLIVVEVFSNLVISELNLTGILLDGSGLNISINSPESGKIEFPLLPAGLYSVSLITENGCETEIQVEITESSVLPIFPEFTMTSTYFLESGKYTANTAIEFEIIFPSDLTDSEIEWNFGDGNTSNLVNPIHQYSKNGTFQVSLNIKNPIWCIVVSIKEIIIQGGGIRMPNAFTPNGDGLNDYYFPVFNQLESLQFWVYNLWGELLYFSESIDDKGWDGRVRGEKSPLGSYVYKVVYRLDDNNSKSITGSFLLLN